LTKNRHVTALPSETEAKKGLSLEIYSGKLDGYLSKLKDHSRAAISAFSVLESSDSQASLKFGVQKFLNECEEISKVLWNNNNKKLRKYLRFVLFIPDDSPFYPAAFSELKTVIEGIAKTGGMEKELKDKGVESDLGETIISKEPSTLSYDTGTKILSFDGKNYKILNLFLAARDLYASLQFFKELQACTEILEKNPEDATALFQKSVFLYKARRFTAALQFNTQVLEIVPNDYKVWYNRGVILEEMGRLKEALVAYNRTIELEPAFEIPWDNKGVVLAKLGRFEEALETYENILLRYPQYAEAWAGKGSILSTLGKKEEALEAYNIALKIRPDYIEALICVSNLFSRLGRFEEALLVYDRALQLAPEDPGLWAGRGLVLLELHRHEEALENCNKALELKPGFVPALEIKIRVISEISRKARTF
jgi:tetratricopeptide (TPR) repeat protein